MKNLFNVFASFGAIGVILGIFLLWFLPIVATFYGLYLAFSASLVLGLLVLFIQPTPLILGFLGIIGHPEVAAKIAAWLHTLGL